MPADIRSFFAVKPPTGGAKQPTITSSSTASMATRKKAPNTVDSKPKARGGRRLTVDDDDDSEAEAIVAPKKKPAVTPRKATPKVQKATEISTSEFFGTSKSKKSSPTIKSTTTSLSQTTSTGPASKSLTHSAIISPRDEAEDDDKDAGDDIFTSEYRRGPKDDDYMDDSDDDDVVSAKPASRARGAATKVVEDSSDDDLEVVKPKAVKAKTTTTKPKRATPVQRKQKADAPEDDDIAAVLDSVQQVRLPTPPPSGEPAAKFNFAAVASRTAPPPGGSTPMELPVGAENCLAGLVFVFTGILKTLDRGEGQQLVKRHGGKVTAAPSSKTSFVVLGDDAGPKKLEVIRKNGIRTINEDGLFDLIQKLPAHGGNGKAAIKYREQEAIAETKIQKQAEEMEREEAARLKAQKANQKQQASSNGGLSSFVRPPKVEIPSSSKLWTVKYAPTQLSQICGNKTTVEKLQRWLHNFAANQKKGFKMGGADGSGIHRAVMIHGPPGIGKTTAAHLVAKMEGYDIIESNASDSRSKKLVEEGLRGVLGTTSLLGYFAADGLSVDKSKRQMVLIMDEVDGMSAGDRGGVGALAAVCKKSEIPIILICNERKLPKMKPFDRVTFDMPFRRPTTDQIRSRISTIAFREKIKVPPRVIDALIEGSGADIRQVVNMLSAAKLDCMADAAGEDGGDENAELDFDKGRSMAKSWEKHAMLKPWDIAGKILSGGMFSESSTSTLNQKAELYFNDHDFSHLMLQENYLSTMPIRANVAPNARSKNLRALEMATLAAESISDGDLIDRMIHGPQQHWALMPAHAIFSFVRPASFVAGPMRPGSRIDFTRWLGSNSSQGKRERLLKDLQARIRLTGSGSREEVRLQYLPALWAKMAKRLEEDSKDVVDEVIDLMDKYYLVRDDFDAILELGMGEMGNGDAGVKIPTAAKAAFTRLYNQRPHPVAYMKGAPVSAGTFAVAKAPRPDLEEAVEDSDVEDNADEDGDGKTNVGDSQDLTKDKFIRQPKKKAAPRATKGAAKPAAAKSSAKRKRPADDDDSDASVVSAVKKPAKRSVRAKK